MNYCPHCGYQVPCGCPAFQQYVAPQYDPRAAAQKVVLTGLEVGWLLVANYVRGLLLFGLAVAIYWVVSAPGEVFREIWESGVLIYVPIVGGYVLWKQRGQRKLWVEKKKLWKAWKAEQDAQRLSES